MEVTSSSKEQPLQFCHSSSTQAQGAQGSQHFARVWALQPGSVLTRRFFANHPTVLQVRYENGRMYKHAYTVDRNVCRYYERRSVQLLSTLAL